jgi:acyl-CoA thioester hydrolase
MKTKFLYQTTVPLYEVDLGGGVYHGNYYHFFESAREALLEEIGFPYTKMMELGNHLAVAEATCVYRIPLRYNDKIEICSTFTKISSRSLNINQEIRNLAIDKPTTILDLILVCINKKGSAATLPDGLKKALTLL